MKLTCMIIDDEPIARRLLQEYIEDIDFLTLAGTAENPLKANTYLSRQPVDLLFLDINMPKLTGIEFLRASKNLPMVIITTAYAEHAREGFELDVMDYLVKPFSFERFLKACNKAREYYLLKNAAPTIAAATKPVDGYFFVKCDGRLEKLLYSELVYVEAMLNYVVLHTDTRKLMVYLTIKSIAEQLPADIFLKVHKSYIVNKQKIKSIEGNELTLANAKVTISQNFYERVMKEILQGRMIKRRET